MPTTDHSHRSGHDEEITIRRLGAADAESLRVLAEREGRRLPTEPVLGAMRGRRLIAAIALEDDRGSLLADPFEPTAAAVELLRTRSRQLREERGPAPRRGLLALFGPRRARAALAGSPPGGAGRLLRL